MSLEMNAAHPIHYVFERFDPRHPPMLKLVRELARQPWIDGYKFTTSLFHLWMGRKGSPIVEMDICYGDGTNGGWEYIPELKNGEAFDVGEDKDGVESRRRFFSIEDTIAEIRRFYEIDT
jgi:hypothetical protein